MKHVHAETPDDLTLHVIADNYAVNLVERFLAAITNDVIRHGSFTSVDDLVRAITAYLAERNCSRPATRGPLRGRPSWPRFKRGRDAQARERLLHSLWPVSSSSP